MQISPKHILPGKHQCYYLFGEDHDALFEAAEALLQEGVVDANRLRVDISELERVEVESRSQGLFGPQSCLALVRNADHASPKQGEHMLKLASSVQPGDRLILCAADNTWKKALHKKMLAMSDVVCCEFKQPTRENFEIWLREVIKGEHLDVHASAVAMMAERLYGMRGAVRQLIGRMKLYDHNEGVHFDVALLSALLGERTPDDVNTFCHAVAMKEPVAIALLRHLIVDQQASDVMLQSWLSTRFHQLLMYLWHQGNRAPHPIQAAKIFGEASKLVPQEISRWTALELMQAVCKINEVEKLLKGASVESRLMVLERLILDLIRK